MTDDKLKKAILHIQKRLEDGNMTDVEALVRQTSRNFNLDAKDELALEKVLDLLKVTCRQAE